MAANKKPAAKPLPKELVVKVRYSTNAYIARALGMSASSTADQKIAARVLARKLGYSTSADVRYVREIERNVWEFKIVEVGRE